MSASVQELRIADIGDRFRQAMYDHVLEHPDYEVGGVLVGRIDGRTGRPRVTGVIPALEAVGERASVTFTHEAWETILERQEDEFPNTQIIGWYHSHPGFGIFLSEHDLFIHRNFFGDLHQFAYVIDPHTREEGIFGWRDGEVAMFEDGIVPASAGSAAGGIASVPADPADGASAPAPASFAAAPAASASSSKLTIGLDDLTDEPEPQAASGLVVGDEMLGAPSARPRTGAGLGAVAAAPRRPMDPRAERERELARRRRGLLAGVAGVVVIAGVGAVVATSSGGGGARDGAGVSDNSIATKVAELADEQRARAERNQASDLSDFGGELASSQEAWKVANAPKPDGPSVNPDGPSGNPDGPETAPDTGNGPVASNPVSQNPPVDPGQKPPVPPKQSDQQKSKDGL